MGRAPSSCCYRMRAQAYHDPMPWGFTCRLGALGHQGSSPARPPFPGVTPMCGRAHRHRTLPCLARQAIQGPFGFALAFCVTFQVVWPPDDGFPVVRHPQRILPWVHALPPTAHITLTISTTTAAATRYNRRVEGSLYQTVRISRSTSPYKGASTMILARCKKSSCTAAPAASQHLT